MSQAGIDRAALERLLEVIGGESEDLQELIDDYVENAPLLAAKIRTGSEAGDWDAVRIAAHSLKSNARDFGAIQLAEHCAALERQCKEGVPADSETTIAMIEREEVEAREALAGVKVEDFGSG